jgi:CelD/BcsL family acetyltransferase involved in cellulose biosynthesis
MKSWRLLPAAKAFEHYRGDWDALNRAHHNHALLDSRFVAPLVRHFGNDKVMLAVANHSQQNGMAMVVPTALGVWQTFQPSQAPICLLNLGKDADSDEALRGLLCSLPGYAVQLGVLQQDPDYPTAASQHLPEGGQREGIDTVEYIPTARLRLEGTFDDYWKTRSGNLRHNLKRQMKRLEEGGQRLELLEMRDPELMHEAVHSHGELERLGWKAGEGTAIAASNPQGNFYTEVLEALAASGEALAFQLRLDGQVIDSELCLARNGMLIALKTAYDEKIEKLSPGLLLHRKIFESLFSSQGIRVVEFYGRVMEWHLKFTDQVRTMYHLNYWRAPWMAKVYRWAKRRQ